MRMTVLVCDADAGLLEAMEGFGSQKLLVVSAADAETARRRYNRHKPAAVFCTLERRFWPLLRAFRTQRPDLKLIGMLHESTDSKLLGSALKLGVERFVNRSCPQSVFLDICSVVSGAIEEGPILLEGYRQAVDQSFAVSRHGLDGEIMDVNGLFCHQLGLERAEALAGTINPLRQIAGGEPSVWPTLERGESWRGRHSLSDALGEEHIVDLSVVPIRNEGGALLEYVAFLDDVTELVMAGRKMAKQKMDQQLEALQTQKRHNEEMARLKDSFLTVFSHEVRTPLNSIINFSEHAARLVGKSEMPRRETVLEELELIRQSGFSILEMITNARQAIRLRDNQVRFCLAEFDFASTLNDLLQGCEAERERSQIVLKRFLETCEVRSDEVQMSLIATNLISNAIKYGDKNIEITLKSEPTEFELIVEDDGPGIADPVAVLELFEQSTSDELRRTAKGTGVGLYVVSRLCSLMGYTLLIERSETLAGARVRVRGPKQIRITEGET